MRISDWSSDVCSSDLVWQDAELGKAGVMAGEDVVQPHQLDLIAGDRRSRQLLGDSGKSVPEREGQRDEQRSGAEAAAQQLQQLPVGVALRHAEFIDLGRRDRKRRGEGKGVTGSVGLGSASKSKKKNN